MAAKMDWENVLLVVLGALVVLFAPGLPLNPFIPHVYVHYIVGVVLVAWGLWKWFGK